MTYRQVARKLRKLGCREREDIGRGSHQGWIREGTSLSTTVPDKGSRDIAIGTIRAIVRQLDLGRIQICLSLHILLVPKDGMRHLPEVNQRLTIAQQLEATQ